MRHCRRSLPPLHYVTRAVTTGIRLCFYKMVTIRRRFMAKPCTPHPHCAASCSYSSCKYSQCPEEESQGDCQSNAFLLDGSQRPVSLSTERKWGLWYCARARQCETTPRPLGAISEEVPCTCTSATMSCCQKSTSSASLISRSRRNRKERQNFSAGRRMRALVIDACEDIPKSFLVCDHPYHPQLVYLSELSSQTLQKRMEEQT